MYRHIDREKINPYFPDVQTVRKDANQYMKNRDIFKALRKAYDRGMIDKQQLLTLRGQLKAGDVDGAVKGLARLTRI